MFEQANNRNIFWEQVNQRVKLRLSHSTKVTYDCWGLTLDLILGLSHTTMVTFDWEISFRFNIRIVTFH